MKRYNYLVLAFKHEGRGHQIQRYIGQGKMEQSAIKDLKVKYSDWFTNEALKNKALLATKKYSLGFLTTDDVLKLERVRYAFIAYCKRFFPNEVEKIERDFELDYIYSTTATEGNTSTLAEVTRILEDGISPKGRSLREVYEIRNYEDVLEYRKGFKKEISMKFILRLHELIQRDIDQYTLGALRRIEVGISGSDVELVPAAFIEEELNQLLLWCSKEKGQLHPVVLAARFHVRFEEIHPFTDGNGRVGREIFNWMVTRSGYPPLNFNVMRRDEYLDGLEKAQHADYRPFMEYIIKNYLEQMRKRLGNSPLKDVLIVERTKKTKQRKETD
jgi:Fic family protein